MNISYNWLHQYLSRTVPVEELTTLLTGCGLEVESVEPFQSVKGGLKNLIIGEVLEASRHPNADRLTITKVNLGNNKISQIVCGAPNVAAGQKVIVAPPGTTIFPLKGEPFEIKSSKIRGEVSEGMICAEDEISLGENHEGIMVLDAAAVPGTPVSEYFKLETDYTVSIGLTPNRADAASHLGVARDLRAVINTAALTDNSLTIELFLPPVVNLNAPAVSPIINVRIESEACTRYSGIHLHDIKVKPSPEWLQARLKAVGLKPVNNVVDVTNFVMYETGQPLHAFDASAIKGKEIIVKPLPRDTKFVTLDGIERKLAGNELMICDAEGGLCIAGVFGGLTSGVKETTTEIFLESACFDAVAIRKASKLHGLKTDASFRFERGSDPEITVTALVRAVSLLQEVADARLSSSLIDIYPHPVIPAKVVFPVVRFQQLTGVSISTENMKRILNLLDIKTLSENDNELLLSVPPYRVDVTREADIVEELLRIYGYDRIPLPSKMNTSFPNAPVVMLEQIRRDTASYLIANGFMEVMSNSLTRSSGSNAENAAHIRNPLSQDLDILRPNMLAPLLDILAYNTNRKRSSLAMFEFGKTYLMLAEGYQESNHLSLLLSGDRVNQHWQVKPGAYSIYYLKSVVENLLTISKVINHPLKWEASAHSHLDNALVLKSGKKEIAVAGLINKETCLKFDLTGSKWFADLNLDLVEQLMLIKPISIQEPPKFPEVRRDLSLLLDKSVQYEALEKLAFETERKILRNVNLFDVYQGDKIGSDKKSYALSFVIRDDEKTLTDKEIDRVMQRLMESFEKKLGAIVRKN
jgi:phenylalanyl-tRNA synthetase beta chain